jgi:transketolase
MPSHFEAAKGAYIARDYRPGQPRGGAIIVQGTSAMASIVNLLPELDQRGLNVKIICATSPELFAAQPETYRMSVLTPGDARFDGDYHSGAAADARLDFQ